MTVCETRKVVLIGDACHAMPPFLGQGANQALQDAVCLSTRLGRVGGEFATVQDALASYERRRKGPTSALVVRCAAPRPSRTALDPHPSRMDTNCAASSVRHESVVQSFR